MTVKRYLTRAEAADYLASLGVPVARSTLAKLATIGGGPTYHRFGKRALYDPSDLDSWVLAKLTRLQSTSDLGAQS